MFVQLGHHHHRPTPQGAFMNFKTSQEANSRKTNWNETKNVERTGCQPRQSIWKPSPVLQMSPRCLCEGPNKTFTVRNQKENDVSANIHSVTTCDNAGENAQGQKQKMPRELPVNHAPFESHLVPSPLQVRSPIECQAFEDGFCLVPVGIGVIDRTITCGWVACARRICVRCVPTRHEHKVRSVSPRNHWRRGV